MPELDEVLRTAPAEQDATLLEGVLVKQRGASYLRTGKGGALRGPLQGDDGRSTGDKVLVAVSQLGNYWVVAPPLPTEA